MYVASVEKIIDHLDVVIEDTAVIKCFQKIQLKLAHEHKIVVVPFDLVCEVEADLAVVLHLAFDLQIVFDDPFVLEKRLGGWPFSWIYLHALDQEVALVFIKESRVLWAVNDCFDIKRLRFPVRCLC